MTIDESFQKPKNFIFITNISFRCDTSSAEHVFLFICLLVSPYLLFTSPTFSHYLFPNESFYPYFSDNFNKFHYTLNILCQNTKSISFQSDYHLTMKPDTFPILSHSTWRSSGTSHTHHTERNQNFRQLK